MPVLVAIAAFIASVVRRPIDPRLKRHYAGSIAVVGGWGLLLVLWLRLSPPDTPALYLTGEICGVTAVWLWSWSLLLSTRANWIEPWFGGLDRMYLWHRRLAIVGVSLMPVHIVMVTPGDVGADNGIWAFGTGVLLGLISVVCLIVLVTMSFPRVSRRIHLRYGRWLSLHRLTGLFVMSAVVHGLLLDYVINASLVLNAVYVIIGMVGLIAYAYAYAYAELVRRRPGPATNFVISTTTQLSYNVLEVVLEPVGEPLTVIPGQFVFLQIGGQEGWREHPFSVAGLLPDGRLRLTIRSLGDDTTQMHERLQAGAPAAVTGPFGMFDYTVGGRRQIWVAGGIGVAPFLGWLSELDDHQLDRVDLYYSTPTEAEAIFQSELEGQAHQHPQVRLHLIRTRASGHLTVDRLTEDADGHLDPHTHFFLCGPKRMVDDLTHDLRRRGVLRDYLHFEHFSFR